jgi:excisionase family DNA binding protein
MTETKEVLEQIKELKEINLLAAKSVLTLNDVSLLTGLSKAVLYKMTSCRQIPFYKPNGKTLYFEKSEVEAWMRRCRVNAVDETENGVAFYLVKGGKQ